jgi:hypothetical protein
MPYPAPTNVVYHDNSKTITFDIEAGYQEGTSYEDPGFDTRNAVVCPSYYVTDGSCAGCGGGSISPSAAKLGPNAGNKASFTIHNVIANVTSYKIRYGLGYEYPQGVFQCSSSQSSAEATKATTGTVGPIPPAGVFLPPLPMISGCGDCAQYVRWLSPPYNYLDGKGAVSFRLLLREIPDPNDPNAPPLPSGTDEWGEYQVAWRSPLVFNQGQQDEYYAHRLDGYRYLDGPLQGQDRDMPSKKWFKAKWQFQDGACAWHDGPVTTFQQPWADGDAQLFREGHHAPSGLRTLTYRSVLTHGEAPHQTSWQPVENYSRV